VKKKKKKGKLPLKWPVVKKEKPRRKVFRVKRKKHSTKGQKVDKYSAGFKGIAEMVSDFIKKLANK